MTVQDGKVRYITLGNGLVIHVASEGDVARDGDFLNINSMGKGVDYQVPIYAIVFIAV